jgi:hypothetical protein
MNYRVATKYIKNPLKPLKYTSIHRRVQGLTGLRATTHDKKSCNKQERMTWRSDNLTRVKDMPASNPGQTMDG